MLPNKNFALILVIDYLGRSYRRIHLIVLPIRLQLTECPNRSAIGLYFSSHLSCFSFYV